jgi:hypothetical protein
MKAPKQGGGQSRTAGAEGTGLHESEAEEGREGAAKAARPRSLHGTGGGPLTPQRESAPKASLKRPTGARRRPVASGSKASLEEDRSDSGARKHAAAD